MDIKIEKYLDRQTKEHKAIIDHLRQLIRTNFPRIRETGMDEGLWYEGKFYIATFANHVNLGVGVSGLSEEEKGYFSGKGRTMRHLKFYSVTDIDSDRLLKLLTLVYTKTKCDCKINWK